jgi:hypothetical protein
VPLAIEVLVSLVVGVIILFTGLWLLCKEKVLVNEQTREVVAFELPIFGKLSTHSPAIAILLIGAAFVAWPLYKHYENPPTLWVSGQISLQNGQTVSGIPNVFIGVLPTSSHATVTLSDGTYSLKIPQGASGETYQALAHVPNSIPPQFILGVVRFDADRRGRFDFTFSRGRR